MNPNQSSKSGAITSVILCGGSGTRLWPLSRKSFPKQFVPLVGGQSLLALTLQRVARFSTRLIAVAAEEHRFFVEEALAAAHAEAQIILEPLPRNTAAAMALAALSCPPEELLLFCPADHFVPDAVAFEECVRRGVAAAASGCIVTFGVVPSFPSTAYGYIRRGTQRNDGSHHVAQFIEKPNADKAQELLLGSDVLWNAGIFLAHAATLVEALGIHAPDILQSCRAAMQDATTERATGSTTNSRFVRPGREAFASCRSQSIDYAVMERHSNTAVVPFSGQWSDVGSWNTVAELSAPDENGNRVLGQGRAHLARNTFVHAPHRPVIALGTQDLVIVDTPDAVLVAHRDSVELVKDVVAQLEKDNASQAVANRKVLRPWGWYDSVDVGDRFQVKRIGVKAGAALSLQKHHHRAEHWVVVKGTAEVTCGEKTFLLAENQSTYIPIGEVHRLRNPGKLELEMIEIQSGSYLGEDDIVRLEDAYGRAG